MPAYDAFISYSHTDQRAAARLQAFLESYAIPGSTGVGRRRLRVFRDKTDIRAGSLRGEILEALASSASLLVCCSPEATGSAWVQHEISTFLDGKEERPIILVMLAGNRETSIPEPLRGRDDLYIDLRKGWSLGLLRPAARLELVRAVARIAGLDLRELIPWDKRRQRHKVEMALLVVLCLVFVGLSAPVRTWQELPVIPAAQRLNRVVSCELQQGKLVLTSRHRGIGPQGGRDYVALHPDALGEPENSSWFENSFNPASRLLPINAVEPEMLSRANQAFDPQLFQEASGMQAGGYLPEIWMGEVAPGSFLAVFALPRELPVDEFSVTPPAQALVLAALQEQDSLSAVADLDPPEMPTQVRSFSPAQGLAMAQGDGEVWLGARLNEMGDAGGLWRSTDAGTSWVKEAGFSSVGSILVDDRSPDRVYVAESPGVRMDGLYEVKVSTRLAEKSGRQGAWRDFVGPPHGGNSEVEFCGFLPDHTLVVRVDERLYARRWTFFLDRLVRPPRMPAPTPAVEVKIGEP